MPLGQVLGWLESFSLLKNYQALVHIATDSNRIGCLDGLRTLAMLAIIALHTLQIHLPKPFMYNPEVQLKANHELFYLDKGVDVFFVIGGLTLTVTFLQAREKR